MLEKILDQNIQSGTSFDKRYLSELANHEKMGPNVPLVYIFSLGPKENDIYYPKGIGKTVYIGETKRELGSGNRFKSHISSSLSEGLSTQINHTLSVYYHQGRELNLRVFVVTNGDSTKSVERILLRSHLHTFGANPMGQGGTGKQNSPKEILRHYSENVDLFKKLRGLYH